MSKEPTISQWVEHFIVKYPTKEDFKIDLDRIINECKEVDSGMTHQLAFYKRVRSKFLKNYK